MHLEELAAWLRLEMTPGLGRRAARRLLAAFGLPAQVFAQPAEALASLGSPELVQALQAEPAGWASQVELTWAWLQQEPATRRVLTLADPAYPPALLATEDPPLLLYASGVAVASWPRG